MLVQDIVLEGKASMAWTRKGTKNVRKYRCTSGPRKGRVMASPASCNKPINIHKSMGLKTTKHKKGQSIKTQSKITKRSNPASRRLKTINTPRRPTVRGRKIR